MSAAPERTAVLDGPAVRRWADAGLAGLVRAQAEIDRLNVYPVPDSDTGTNLVRTMRAGVTALAGERGAGLAAVSETLATAVLRGACGNSGTILSQLVRGLADAARTEGTAGMAGLDASALAAALTEAARLARAGLSRPVEGTILSVADAAAAAASAAAARGAELDAVVQAARRAAAVALEATPGQLAALGGRVDAGGRGLVVLLEALEVAVSGVPVPPTAATEPDRDPSAPTEPPSRPAAGPHDATPTAGPSAPAYEVMYLLAGTGEGVPDLRAALDELGDSVVVVGGNGLWQVHAHVDDVGAAVEAGLAAGRPHQVRITPLAATTPAPRAEATQPADGDVGLPVVVIVAGPGLTDLLTAAGARVLEPHLAGAALLAAVDDAHARQVAVVPSDPDLLATALALAIEDPRLRVVRARSAVQVIAAVAVHEPSRDPERDLLEMSTAAAACRHGLVEVAEGEGMTSAGPCRAGDVLGHVDGDVAIIGSDLAEVGGQVVDRLLGGGGELVTLVEGAPAPAGLAAQVAQALRARRPEVDVRTYDGGQPASYLLVGVE